MKGRGKMPGGAPIFMRYFKYFAVRNFFLGKACLSFLCQFYFSNDTKFTLQ